MCRAKACWRTTFPVPVFLNRLDAPLCVFSLGMTMFQEIKSYHNAQHSPPAGAAKYGARLVRRAERNHSASSRWWATQAPDHPSEDSCTGTILKSPALFTLRST